MLQVQPEAPMEVIRASYRTLMGPLRHHPDLGGEPQEAALLNHAYAVLGRPQARLRYDQALQATARRAAAMPAQAAPRLCPFCRCPAASPAPAPMSGPARCRHCGVPLSIRALQLAPCAELFGRRHAPRLARTGCGAWRLAPDAPARPMRWCDLSAQGFALQAVEAAAVAARVHLFDAALEGVGEVVAATPQGAGLQRVRGRWLSLWVARPQAVFSPGR